MHELAAVVYTHVRAEPADAVTHVSDELNDRPNAPSPMLYASTVTFDGDAP
jgi:hypothetical protein